MQLSRMLLAIFVGTSVISTEGSLLSPGLVSLNVAGLNGLNVHFGIKPFVPAFRIARHGFREDLSVSFPNPFNSKFRIALEINIAPLDAPKKQLVDSSMENTSRSSSDGPVSTKVRREVSKGIALKKGFLRWLKYVGSIDDEKCIHRFFCELGADPGNFGELGRLAHTSIMMGALPKLSWAKDMFKAGQSGRPCTKTCDERELSETVDYLERSLFPRSPDETDSETKENEIF